MRCGLLVMPLMAAALTLVGCKTTEVLVVNDVGKDAQVSLQGPGNIKPSPAVLPVSSGGKAVFKVQTPNEKLPADYEWQAVGRVGTVVITKDTRSQVIMNLSTGKPVAAQVTVEPGNTTSVKVAP